MNQTMQIKTIFALLIMSFFVSCAKKEKEIEKFVVKKDSPSRVEGMILNKKPFESHAIYPGLFKEWDSFTISSDFSGIIEYMPYKVGDFIKKGDTILRINTSSLKAQIKQARSVLNISKINLERTKKLFQKNLTTQAALDDAQFKLDNAKTQMNILSVNFKKSIVRSPFNGYITQKMKSKGELTNFGTPIVKIMKLDLVKFILPVPEKDIDKLSVGDVIDIQLEANNKMFKGIVYRISRLSNPNTHTIDVEIEVKNQKSFNGEFILKPGMLAKAFFSIQRRLNALVIPLDSIIKTETGSYVFIKNEDKAKYVKIKIISISKNNALIESKDLKEGETLITKGMYELINGSEIKIVKLDKNKSKQEFNVAYFKCKKEKDNISSIRKLLQNKELDIKTLFRTKKGYNLAYLGKLPEFLSKCLL